MEISSLWKFVTDEGNQRALGWIGGGAAAAVSTAWGVYVYLYPHQPPPPPNPAAAVQVDKSAATTQITGCNLNAHGDMTGVNVSCSFGIPNTGAPHAK
jgi:hypothetical protein